MGSSAQNSSGVDWCRRRVRFNEVPEKVPEKVWEALVRSGPGEGLARKRFRRKSGRLWCSQVKFNRICGHLIDGNPAEGFAALGFVGRFRKICKDETLRLLGIPPKLILLSREFGHGRCQVFERATHVGWHDLALSGPGVPEPTSHSTLLFSIFGRAFEYKLDWGKD